MLDRGAQTGGNDLLVKTGDAPERRICLLVLGMHRSGTSALTRVLSLAGAALPASLMGPAKSNPLGHWESVRLQLYNNALLESLHSHWNDWRPIDIAEIPAEQRRKIASEIGSIIQAEYAESRLLVLKDPRICRLTPLFLDALRQADIDPRTVIACRNPLEVSNSLKHRDRFGRTHSALLWLRHVLDAEAATRDERRAIISFERLLRDWTTCFQHLTDQLGMRWPEEPSDFAPEVEAFLTPVERHHSNSLEDVLLDPALKNWVGEVYAALLALESEPKNRSALATLDRIGHDFNEAVPIMHRLLDEVREAHASTVRDLQTKLGRQETEVDSLKAKLLKKKEEADSLRAKLLRQREEAKSLAAKLAERVEELADRSIELVRRDREAKALRKKLSELQAQLTGIYASSSWLITAPLRLAGQRLPRLQRPFKYAITLAYRLRARWRLWRDASLLGRSELFDRDWYLARYPDVAAAGVDPVRHYLVHGAREGRNPGPNFDTRFYLAKYQDVRAANVSPLAHYLRFGKAEGRKARAPVTRIPRFKAWQLYNGPNRLKQRLMAESLASIKDVPPKFSVIMPVYDPPIDILNRAIESVLNQSYENLELILVDDCSTNPEVKRTVSHCASRDRRIKVIFSDSHGHISATTNIGAAAADGEFLAFVDHDDELPADALAQFALYIASHPETDIVYSDDAKLDPSGSGLISPKFKSDWSPELLLSYCYVSHLKVIRASLFKEVGGCRIGFEGSQDHDLILRASERARHIGHIPQVLYHRRILPNSTASSGHAKPYSFEAGRRAAEESFHRRGVPCRVEHPEWAWRAGLGIYTPVMPDTGPTVGILVPTRNNCATLKQLIASLERTTYRNYRIYVIDDGSDHAETVAYLSQLPHRVIRSVSPDGKFNFARLNNEAAKQISEDYVLFLNDDTQVLSPRWLSQMVGWLGLPGVGAVGARLLFPDDRVQNAGVVLDLKGRHNAFQGLAGSDLGYLALAKVSRNVSAVAAAAMLTPRGVFLRLGGFDEENFAVSYNDVDYCLRLQEAGYRVVFCGEAELYHYESKSRGGTQIDPAEVAALHKRIQGRRDPFYNPHLDRETCKYEIKPTVVPPVTLAAPLRVLVVTHNLNHEGAPNSALELILGLKRRGFIDPVVISPQDGPLRAHYEGAGIRVQIASTMRSIQEVEDLGSYDRHIDELRASAGIESYDLVYGNTALAYWAIDAARRSGVPSIWNIRESSGWETYYSSLPSQVQARALLSFGAAYRVVFVAEATRKIWALADQTSNFQVIPNGLNIERFQTLTMQPRREEARRKLGVRENDVCVLLLGTVCRRKGQTDLVHALQRIPADVIENLSVFIVGLRRDTCGESLRQLVEASPAELRQKVHLIDETGETAVYWNAADLFCCTSRVESYPRVILEAMAKGLPIITTPVFGIRQQVREEVNALFYEPGDVARLASHLELLVEDADLRARFASNSRAVLGNLIGYSEMLDEYEKAFRAAAFSSVPSLG